MGCEPRLQLDLREDVEYVVNTPLLDSIVEDSLCWWPDSRGMFVVKSTYNIILNNLMNNVALHSDRSIVMSMEAPLL